MAYNNGNLLKENANTVLVYFEIKAEKPHLPDTHIVRYEMPKRGIFISYRKWMMVKNAKPTTATSGIQLSMF